MLLLLTLACTGNPAPTEFHPSTSEPEVSAVAETTPAIVVEPVPSAPVAQVRIEDVRASYVAHVTQLTALQTLAKQQGLNTTAQNIGSVTTILQNRFSPAEFSTPDADGQMNELLHDQHDEQRWTYTLLTETLNISAWDSESQLLYLNAELGEPSLFATSQLCHELRHVQDDLPYMQGTSAQQGSTERRERDADALAFDVLNVGTNGRYGTLIAERAKAANPPADGSFYVEYIPQEIYDLVGVHSDFARGMVYQQAIIHINAAIIERTVPKGKAREDRLNHVRDALAEAMTDPEKFITMSFASDQ